VDPGWLGAQGKHRPVKITGNKNDERLRSCANCANWLEAARARQRGRKAGIVIGAPCTAFNPETCFDQWINGSMLRSSGSRLAKVKDLARHSNAEWILD